MNKNLQNHFVLKPCTLTPRSRNLVFRFFLALSCTIFLIPISGTASPHDAWKKGNEFYQQKAYDSAAYYFEEIAASMPADATIYFNLGNTYYRLNKIGLSVLNYQRALRRKPDYKEASDNLLLAQSRIPGGVQSPQPEIFFIRWWQSITAPGLTMLWAILSLISFIVLIGLLLYRRLRRGEFRVRPQVLGALVLIWLTCLLLAFSSVFAALSQLKGVVLKAGTAFSSETKSPKGGETISEGITVKISGKQGANYTVELPDGREGKIAVDAVALVD